MSLQLKNILCYGDSNTWGYVPNKEFKKATKRFSRAERWPGVLQHLLGEQYHIIEEGLNGRTLNKNYHIPPDRNGTTYLSPCLYSHAPIDLAVLFLGGNNLKCYFNESPEEIGEDLAQTIEIIQASDYGPNLIGPPQLLIVSQPILLPIAEQYVDEDGRCVLKDAIEKTKQLTSIFNSAATKTGSFFLDVSDEIKPSQIDGVHLDAKNHKKLALILDTKIKKIFHKDVQSDN